jgi:hypothetical protein
MAIFLIKSYEKSMINHGKDRLEEVFSALNSWNGSHHRLPRTLPRDLEFPKKKSNSIGKNPKINQMPPWAAPKRARYMPGLLLPGSG